jgi:ankyrin repeat protein
MISKCTLALALIAVAVGAQEQPAIERFHQAIRNDDRTSIRTLIGEFRADPRGPGGETPLMYAAAFGSSEAVQLLIASGADARAASNSGVTALHWAAGNAEKVRLLLDQDADVNARSALGKTPLLVASATNGTAASVRLLLEKGADPNAADNTRLTPLISAVGVDDAEVTRLLLAHGADVNARADAFQATTALIAAAYNGNVEITRLLLARKADAGVVGYSGGNVKNGPLQTGQLTALHTAMVGGSAELVSLLLEAGAALDPVDMRGMTPLMWSVATDRPETRVVRTLLKRGADVSVRSKSGESTADWARKFNDLPVLGELEVQGVPIAAEGAAVRTSADLPRGPREAVERSMPLLRSASARMLPDGGCVACHAQPLAVMAGEFAGRRGWAVASMAGDSLQAVTTLSANAPGLLQAREAGASPDREVYIAMMMAEQNAPASFATDALVHYLAAKQRSAGNWHGQGATRAPIQDGDFSRTAMAIRTLAVYAIPARRVELSNRIKQAATWLEKQTPRSTEDRVMQVLGLKWADASMRTREARTRELLAAQRADGGWAQTPYLGSDAYATGQVLYLLREMSIPATDRSFQRGTQYLLRTQAPDGSWHVKSRAMKIQPYFESGFPYGHDQWVSQAATAWATMALSLSEPERPAPATTATGR